MARGTVLIADDDTAIRTVLNQALARAGYAPRATGNATTLWRWVSQGEGDVVLTDVVMPDENAFDLILRIIAATHRDLKAQIQQGLFREDLFYRLNVVPIRIPPLRERLEDVGDLVRHFLRQAAREGLGQKSIEAAAIDRLKAHPWPGNIRELENFVRRVAALYTQDTLTAPIIE